MTAETTVLVADDDDDVLALVGRAVRLQGFTPLFARDGVAALETLRGGSVDLAILDLRMPGMSGVEVTDRIRGSSQVPIIILTAASQEREVVGALEAGADDYVRKPFSTNELMARVQAVLRRCARAQTELRFGDLELAPAHFQATAAGTELPLTPTEFKLLHFLVAQAPRTIPHEALLEEVWGQGYRTESHLLHVTISRLRQKLGKTSHVRIRSIPGIGYRLLADADVVVS